MMTEEIFKQKIKKNLTDNILSYWIDRMVDPRGGFYGRRDGYDRLDADAPKGAILNARILWTFSSAYRITGNKRYAEMASRAADYISENFIDPEYGGVYWSVDFEGNPLDTKKQFYAIAFAIYGFSEHYRATGEHASLDRAIALFRTIEKHSRDRLKGGYIEACMRDWAPISDMRLSDKDFNASKTMNTHLHILEAYTSLLRIWKDESLTEATESLLKIFLDTIMDPATGHLGLFFDDDWHRLDNNISYGHDIEASWLMLESAEVIGNEDLYRTTLDATRQMALAALEGKLSDGSMIYERLGDGETDTDLHWWVQAENVVGQLYLWKYHDMKEMLEEAMRSWRYIDREIVDHENGEWYWSRRGGDGSIDRDDDKAGFWKCPYHNGRMCMETLRLLDMTDII